MKIMIENIAKVVSKVEQCKSIDITGAWKL